MTTVAVGIVHAVTAAAYLFLFCVALAELHRAARKTSFAIALTLMFVGCGSHHFVHAEHALLHGVESDPLVLVALVIAAVPSATFLALRIEAMCGGRGDRLLAGTPAWLALLPAGLAVSAGALLAGAVAYPRAALDVPGIVSNLVLLATYSTVGWYLFRAQAARRPLTGGWSLSGISLGIIFPMCALAHVVNALVAPSDLHSLLVDGYQIPASLFFLWSVRRVHRRALRDLSRRPVIGRPTPTRRRSPWAVAAR